jgi:hypothetical protein
MRGVLGVVFVVALASVFALCAPTTAQHGHRGNGMMDGGMMGGRGMMMGSDSAGGCPMMGMGMMMPRQVVPVNGGIVVVMGNKLIKFDEDLEKQKEVTLEVDEEALERMMERMRNMRSRMQQMTPPPAEEEEGQ